jgi:hypothetical protein
MPALVADRPDGSLHILAFTIAVAVKADGPTAKLVGMRIPKNELDAAISHPDGGCRLATAEHHGQFSAAVNVVMAVTSALLVHADRRTDAGGTLTAALLAVAA